LYTIPSQRTPQNPIIWKDNKDLEIHNNYVVDRRLPLILKTSPMPTTVTAACIAASLDSSPVKWSWK